MRIRSQTTLFFIRHGETAANKQRIRQGVQIDDYLDTQGVLQIQQMAKLISHLDLDVLYTSYLHRAEETAALIDKTLSHPVPILHDFRLRERDFGSLTGKSRDEWDKILPDNREKEALQIYDYRPFGGESVDDVRQRGVSAILDIINNHDRQNVGLVTHNGIIRLLLFHFPDIPRIYRQDPETTKDIANADIYEWEITDGRLANLKSLLNKNPLV
ncbi:MAG TPA: histidine phosphatase family protein [Patescibacteria group bacterium]|nr:histidine phosphatase family protein [Patescibacteria group bacterium]